MRSPGVDQALRGCVLSHPDSDQQEDAGISSVQNEPPVNKPLSPSDPDSQKINY